MNITPQLTDVAILTEIGERIAHRRIEAGWTQHALASAAGLGKRTVERLEAGGATELVSFIKALRALELLGNLDVLLPRSELSPMALVELRGRERKRVRPRKSTAAETRTPWQWGE